MLRRRCDREGRAFDDLTVSQQCLVVIAETEDAAREALGKAVKGTAATWGRLEAHGIWARPRASSMHDRHRALGAPTS